MLSYLLRRARHALGVLGTVALLAFLMFRYVGDPVQVMLGEETTPEARQRVAHELGLDDPLVVQFGRFVRGAMRGDLGRSYRSGVPVTQLMAERLPATVDLVLPATFLSALAGVLVGVWLAVMPPGPARTALRAASLVGVSVPTFLVGLVLIIVFAVYVPVLPPFGRGQVVDLGPWNTGLVSPGGLKALVLPTLTLASFQASVLARLVMAEMLGVLRSDFIRAAHARGIPRRAVHLSHAFRNALVPIVTVAGVQLGTLISFSLVTETVFQWPGLGLLFVQAVADADIPVMVGYLLFVGALFALINIGVDLIYVAVDPRLSRDWEDAR